MVIGRGFAWGHIPKTGGDATMKLFSVVPDIVIAMDARQDPRKHDPFEARHVFVPRFILNIRRLPAWLLSLMWQRHLYGKTRMPVMSPNELASWGVADEMIANFTDRGRLKVPMWLRMEHLRQDFLGFVRTLRPVTASEERAILTVRTKPPIWYDHNIVNYFSDEHLRRMYSSNPRWAEVEERAYGFIPNLDDYRATGGLPENESLSRTEFLAAGERLLRYVWNRMRRQGVPGVNRSAEPCG